MKPSLHTLAIHVYLLHGRDGCYYKIVSTLAILQVQGAYEQAKNSDKKGLVLFDMYNYKNIILLLALPDLSVLSTDCIHGSHHHQIHYYQDTASFFCSSTFVTLLFQFRKLMLVSSHYIYNRGIQEGREGKGGRGEREGGTERGREGKGPSAQGFSDQTETSFHK